MTPQQQATLKAYILADPALAAISSGPATDYNSIAIALNAASTFVLWRKSVTTAEVGNAVNYIAVEAMTDANRGRITTFYTMNPANFDPSRADMRSYWSNTFSGALGGQGQATRDALEALWRRNATVAEKTLATGTGTFASPGAPTFEGSVSISDVAEIMAA